MVAVASRKLLGESGVAGREGISSLKDIVGKESGTTKRVGGEDEGIYIATGLVD